MKIVLRDIMETGLLFMIAVWSILCVLDFIEITPSPFEMFTFLVLSFLMGKSLRRE